MERRFVIHGSTMGGYGLPGMLAFVGALGAIEAVLTRIWARPAALTLWLIIVGGAVLTILFVEAVNRRNVVEVSGDRIRWSFRQPPVRGDHPLSDLRKVEVFSSGACLEFDEGRVCATRDMFRRREINRLIEALRQLGAQVSGSGPSW
jgi:hypothetical protein